jgi:hypothetical protein
MLSLLILEKGSVTVQTIKSRRIPDRVELCEAAGSIVKPASEEPAPARSLRPTSGRSCLSE